MALTKVTGSVIKDSVSLSGNVSIGGTLTYQDVTNIDSLGIITARTGVDVSGGQLDVGSNVKIGNSGVATATNFKTGSSNLHSTGLTVGNNFLHSTGINVGTGATIHVPATNVITFGTSDSERLRITSGGDFGIGTNNPQSRLEVKDNSSNNYGTTIRLSQGYNSVFSEISTNFGGSMTLNAGQGGGTPIMHFQVNDSEKMRLDSDGRLLVGDSNASGAAILQVQKTSGDMILVRNHATNYESLILSVASGTADIYASSGGSTSRPALRFITNDTERLRIKSDGKIQLSSATSNTIHSSSDNSKIAIFAGSTDSVNHGGVIAVTGVNHSAGCFTDVSAGAGGYIKMRVGTSEKLRINSSGQMMIGNNTVGNSTTEKLILQGQIGNGNYESSIALRRGSTIGTNDAGLGYIKFQDSAGSTGAQMGGRADSGWSGSSRPTHLLFHTTQSGSSSLTERMRIHSGGSVTKPHMPIASLTDSRANDINNAELTSSNFYNGVHVNQGNHFNASNGRFTCPVAGIYRIFFRATTDQTYHTNVRLRKNGSTINEAYAAGTSGTTHSDSSEAIVNCSAGDYLHIQASRLKTSGGGQHKQVTFQLLH